MVRNIVDIKDVFRAEEVLKLEHGKYDFIMLKKAFHNQMRLYHPDVTNLKDKQFASVYTKEINQSFDLLKEYLCHNRSVTTMQEELRYKGTIFDYSLFLKWKKEYKCPDALLSDYKIWLTTNKRDLFQVQFPKDFLFWDSERKKKLEKIKLTKQNKKEEKKKREREISATNLYYANTDMLYCKTSTNYYFGSNSPDYKSKKRIIKFGHYCISEKKTNISLLWNIIRINSNKALLLCTSILFMARYSDSLNDKDHGLHVWLNSVFLNYFSEPDLKKIIPTNIKIQGITENHCCEEIHVTAKIFCLNKEEASKVATDTLRNLNTLSFDRGRKLRNKNSWWLRSAGDIMGNISFVDEFGNINSQGKRHNNNCLGVRPAMWIITS